MVEIIPAESSSKTPVAQIAIDVSSDWSKFPRYGFLSDYGDLSDSEMKEVIDNLNRHHINGLQFYDWQYKHHKPLAGTGDNPDDKWKDIIDKDVYFSTVERYIELAHQRNMQAMFYNLAFGALSDAKNDGVSNEWYLFNDENHLEKDMHELPIPPFKSHIYLTNPGNSDWQDYLNAQNDEVYEALEFDGFHIDQLGDRGFKYDYWGGKVDLALGFESFIKATKKHDPDKGLVMNAVNQYGQSIFGPLNMEFLYTEVWDPYKSYEDLAGIIKENNSFSSGSKNTVLAAYMNYNLAENEGEFNTPGVLLTNAVTSAFGGSHLELGEHMLGKEYFPNNNLKMKDDLKTAIVSYYDFLVAYQNYSQGWRKLVYA